MVLKNIIDVPGYTNIWTYKRIQFTLIKYRLYNKIDYIDQMH